MSVYAEGRDGVSTIAGTAVLPAADPRPIGRGGEQSRARYPDIEGFVERDGQRLFYEVYGAGEETVFLLPTWSLVHSRHWKMQIPYFARHFRVLAMDGTCCRRVALARVTSVARATPSARR